MTTCVNSPAAVDEVACVTFRCGGLLAAVEIERVQEINRHLQTTDVPGAPGTVRGVINLRGQVMTVVDPRAILGLEPAVRLPTSRNVIVTSGDERIGLWVDAVADYLRLPADELLPPPPNVKGIAGRFLRGVFPLADEIVVLLNLDELLAVT